MKIRVLPCALGVCLASAMSPAQPSGNAPSSANAQPASKEGSPPLYQVTVVQRTVKAVNYQYRAEPTEIDFHGTVLLPDAKGHAWIQSKQGRTEVDASLERMQTSQRFGREYLTYVLWAISPEGRPHNLGEVVLGGSDKGRLRVTTELQAFALIVTAEPYAAVRTPSDAVVLENEIRPDTVGRIETVDAKYELLPRGQYTLSLSDDWKAQLANAPKVSAGEYDAILELYQAQTAVGLAGAAGAQQYAQDTYAKAQQLLATAQEWRNKKGESRRVVEYAREAAQTAEDARVIAQQRQQQEQLQAATARAQEAEAQARAEIASAQVAKQQAELVMQQAEQAAQQARADAESAQQAAEAERQARAEADAEAAKQQEAAQTQARLNAARSQNPPPSSAQATALRIKIFEELNSGMAVRDTPRGLVVTIPDSDFNGQSLRSRDQVARIAALVARYPGLQISCEGHMGAEHSQAASRQRAEAVRNALVASGAPAARISVTGYGNTRPLGPETTAEGRAQNSRVEIVISGDPIGTTPYWDRTYSLSGRRGE
jgi:flagellar motor protein MotB